MTIRNYFQPAAQASGDGAARPPPPLKKKASSQARLNELKKVMVLKTSYMNPSAEEIQRLKEVLDSGDSSAQQLVQALRTLDCYQLTLPLLIETQVGRSARLLQRKHAAEAEICAMAAAVVAKWSKLVKLGAGRKQGGSGR